MRKPWSDILKTLGPPPHPDIPKADRPNTPPRTLWFRRPDPWSDGHMAPAPTAVTGQVLAEKVSLHHDAADNFPSVTRLEDSGVEIATPEFDGSFLSMALGMTRSEVAEIHNHDIIRLTLKLHTSQPVQTYARLTLVSGPNREERPLEMAETNGSYTIEWDLFFTKFDAMRAHDAWIDLIFENPANTTIRIDDLYMLRHPRANF